MIKPTKPILSKRWVCIAWRRGSHESVCKSVTFHDPQTAGAAMAQFRLKCPLLRDHTVQAT
jgi:hypothetical protein